MTDNERYYTTKVYLDKLANGMNPLTGDDLPEDTILNDVCLCRAFSFASSVLEEVIKNGCRVTVYDKKDMVPFTITEQQRSKITISDAAVTVTAITNRIERVLDRNVKPISPARVTQWLELQGLLETEFDESGKRVRIATEEGNRLGIETKEETFRGETIKKSYYNLNAQAFIIANLFEIAKATDSSLRYGIPINGEIREAIPIDGEIREKIPMAEAKEMIAKEIEEYEQERKAKKKASKKKK